jgi:hypothetical protein
MGSVPKELKDTKIQKQQEIIRILIDLKKKNTTP